MIPVNKIVCGDCYQVMQSFPANSIDCIVTDPPYGISFMGKDWDKALPPKEAFAQMYRVLKPGALAFVMSSPRQDVLWRMIEMLESCGFELKQSFISWIYKTGFPKAYDVALGIDIKFIRKEFLKEHGRKPTRKELKKLLDEKRKFVAFKSAGLGKNRLLNDDNWDGVGQDPNKIRVSEPASDLAKKWQGWKSITGLKPALEVILMVNKPLSERTIVDNVLKHGTGAVNVDACRIPIDAKVDDPRLGGKGDWSSDKMAKNVYEGGYEGVRVGSSEKSRFPANLLVSDKAFGDQSRYFDLDAWGRHHGFLDVAKPSKREKDKGLETLPEKDNLQGLDTRGRTLVREDGSETLVKRWKASGRNVHPTVKPIKLMAYLIELGCPPDGIVLDPFMGSGTTCIAAQRLSRKWIGIEINSEYAKIASARLGNVEVVTKVTRKDSKPKRATIERKYSSGKCGYSGKCDYKTTDGSCSSKRYCKDKE